MNNATDSTLVQRFRGGDPDDLFEPIELVTGDGRDYVSLCEHHYRNKRPATMVRVLAFRHRGGKTSAFVARCFPARAAGRETVAVLVESMPPLDCRMRDEALSNRYRSVKARRVRAAMINREVRTISRVIVHPSWRGLGLARRLVQFALASATTPFTEAFAAMGRVHPFFRHAGMTAYERPPHLHDARLRAVLRTMNIDALAFASSATVMQHIAMLPRDRQRWLVRELQRWHRSTHRGSAGESGACSLSAMLHAAQRALVCEPVYFLHDNRPLLGETNGRPTDGSLDETAPPRQKEKQHEG